MADYLRRAIVAETKVVALIASYEAKVEDLRRETLRTSAALAACAQRGIKAPPHVVGAEGVGWDMAMEYVERAIRASGGKKDS